MNKFRFIARNSNGKLNIFTDKPEKFTFTDKVTIFSLRTGMMKSLDEHLFREITFENSPQLIKFEKL